MNRARTIIASAASAVAAINDPRDRLARQVGILQGEIRALCDELDPIAPPLADEGEDDDLGQEPIRDDRFADCAAADWFDWRTR